MTNLAAVKHSLAAYSADIVHGTVLDRAEIERQIEHYRTCAADERRQIVGLQPNRAEVILAARMHRRAMILASLGRDALTSSDRGLRHGLLVERFGAEPSLPRAAHRWSADEHGRRCGAPGAPRPAARDGDVRARGRHVADERVPIVAGLLGLLASLRMSRLRDPVPAASGEAVAFG